MFEKVNITKEMAEATIIGKKREEFIKDLEVVDNFLVKWGDGEITDKTFMYYVCKKLGEIRRSVAIYK